MDVSENALVMSMNGRIRLKRAYEKPSSSDGYRVLVERLWPRGVSKEAAKLDLWLKEIAPSTELRTWYGHDPAKWKEFRKRYTSELRANTKVVQRLRDLSAAGTLTLIYAARDEQHNSALVLKDFLQHRPAHRRRR